jgi:hypothetical protein
MSSQLTNSKVVVWGNNIGVVYTNVSAAENLPQSSTFGRDGDEAAGEYVLDLLKRKPISKQHKRGQD